MIEGKFIVGRYLDVPEPLQTDAGAPVAGFQRMNQVMLHINVSTRAYGIVGAKTSTTGAGHIAKAHRNYQWLKWRPGFVSEVTQFGTDVLTGPMSGCWITLYMNGGVQCVGHVGTEDERDSANSKAAKKAWNDFAATAVGGITGFNPLAIWADGYPAMDHSKDAPPKIFGIVTAANTFFSVFTFPQLTSRTTLRVAGIRPANSTLPAVLT